EAAIERMPPGPSRDRAQLEAARMALDAGDLERAKRQLGPLPERLRPADEERRRALLERVRLRERGGRLGVALPLTGPYAGFGERALRGMVLGLGTFADPPFPYEVVVRDTAGDPDRAAGAVEALVREGVVAIVGPLRSVASVAAAPVAERAGVPLLSLARQPDLPELGEYVFRFGLTADDQVRALARYAVERLGRRHFAILYPRDAYGTDFKNRFWDQVEALGAELVGVESYPSDAVDLQPEIKKLVGLYWLTPEERTRIELRDRLLRHPRRNEEALADPNLVELPPIIDFDALFVPDAARRVGLILPQLRFFDVRDVTLLGTSDWNDNDLIEIAGREARGAVFTDAFFAGSPFPFVKDFVNSYYSAYGAEPERLAATGYDAGGLLRSILDAKPTLSRERLRDALLEVRDYPGVAGLTSFDASGGTHHSLYLLTVKRGAIEQIEP
ncbi:MAG: penicillin-binding protein activator, partial [Myxococcota bacterium]